MSKKKTADILKASPGIQETLLLLYEHWARQEMSDANYNIPMTVREIRDRTDTTSTSVVNYRLRRLIEFGYIVPQEEVELLEIFDNENAARSTTLLTDAGIQKAKEILDKN